VEYGNMADEFFLRRGGKVLGPIGSAVLKQRVSNGKVLASDEISKSTTGPWKRVESVPSLRDLISTTDEKWHAEESDDDFQHQGSRQVVASFADDVVDTSGGTRPDSKGGGPSKKVFVISITAAVAVTLVVCVLLMSKGNETAESGINKGNGEAPFGSPVGATGRERTGPGNKPGAGLVNDVVSESGEPVKRRPGQSNSNGRSDTATAKTEEELARNIFSAIKRQDLDAFLETAIPEHLGKQMIEVVLTVEKQKPGRTDDDLRKSEERLRRHFQSLTAEFERKWKYEIGIAAKKLGIEWGDTDYLGMETDGLRNVAPGWDRHGDMVIQFRCRGQLFYIILDDPTRIQGSWYFFDPLKRITKKPPIGYFKLFNEETGTASSGGDLPPDPTGTGHTTTSRTRTVSELIRVVEPAVVKLEVATPSENRLGSGFIVSPDGVVVTNYHVMENAKKAVAVFVEKDRVPIIGVWYVDLQRDIAIVQLEKTKAKFHVLPVSKSLPQKGDQVIALGSPQGLDFTVSDGLVIGVRKSRDLPRIFRSDVSGTWVQTTATISQGNSGGPLIGYSGTAVAMNTWCSIKGQNLNFAISCTDILAALRNVRTGRLSPVAIATKSNKDAPDTTTGQIKDLDSEPIDPDVITYVMKHRVWFGVNARPVLPTGEQVTVVHTESPAADAVMRSGDIITAINGKNLEKGIGLAGVLETHKSGDELKVSIRRRKRPRILRVKIRELISQTDLALIEGKRLKRRQREFLARFLVAYRHLVLSRATTRRPIATRPVLSLSRLLSRGAAPSILSAMQEGDGVNWGPAFGQQVEVQVGQIGYFRGTNVQRIVSPTEVAVRVGSATIVIVADTESLSDGAPLRLSCPCQIVRAAFYEKVLGGTKKVFLAVPSEFANDVKAIVDSTKRGGNEASRNSGPPDAALFKLCRRGRDGTIVHFVAKPRFNDSDLRRTVGDNQSLETINLFGTRVSDSGMEVIKGLGSIEALDLRKTSVTATGIATLKGLKLKYLLLPKRARTDDGLGHYVNAIRPSPRLSLEDWNVTDKAMTHVQSLGHIRQLTLEGTQVTDECIAYVAKLRGLQSLNLCRTRVTDKGVVRLKGLASLRDLDVSEGSLVTVKGAGLLQMYLPKCTIRLD
jgi:S1-C subfamily serine protease